MAKDKKTDPQLPGSQFGDAEESPGFLFWKAFNLWSRQIRRELETLGLTQVQYSILAALGYLGSNRESVSQQEIANQLSMDKMMVSDVVKTLEGKKLLVRQPHPLDARAFSLHLTPKARALLKAAIPLVEGADARFFGQLGPSDARAFTKFLGKLLKPPV